MMIASLSEEGRLTIFLLQSVTFVFVKLISDIVLRPVSFHFHQTVAVLNVL